MARLILRNRQSPGDVLMLTAAVRDLHRCYPGRFQTDVRTTAEALWENNPHLTPFAEGDADVETLDCHYQIPRPQPGDLIIWDWPYKTDADDNRRFYTEFETHDILG